MAKKNMTLEEKLDEAIIKDGPYKVPENWVWTYMGNLFDITSSKRVFKDEWKSEGIPFYRAREIAVLSEKGSVDNELFITEEMYGEYKRKYGMPVENDIMITGVGTLGKAYVVSKEDEFYFKDGNILWFKNSTNINPKYIFYLYKSLFMLNQIYSASSGTTVDTYTIINAKKTYCPLPPLKEQQRIVDRIESLFEKLDKAKELIEEARDGFEKRKQSIIESYLKGEFLSGIQLKEIELSSILNFKNGLSKRSGKEGNNTKVLRLADIGDDIIFSENSREMLLTEKETKNYKIENGDLLLIRVNGTKRNVGRAIQYNGNEVCAYCDHLIRIDSEGYNKEYIKFLINSDEVRKQINGLIVSSAGQNTISQSSLNIIKANVIDNLSVQEEIVNSINNFVFKEKKIEELTQLEEQIELIKKSILAKAFRGELGTNSEEDESALELLKEILSED